MSEHIANESELVELTAAELLPLLIDHAQAGESVGIEGPPGGGKSELVAQAAKAAGLPLLVYNIELCDQTDFKGLPFRDPDCQNQVVYLKEKVWLQDYPFAGFFDELPRGTVATQGSVCSLLLEKRNDDVRLHDSSWMVWAGNRTSDRAGANRVPTIVYNRCYNYGLRYCAKSLVEYEVDKNPDDIDLLTVRFLRMKGDQALQFDAGLKINPTPRAWSVVMRKLKQRPDVAFATIAGRLGKGLASELLAFRDLAPKLPSVEEVLMDPKNARLPENNPSAQFLITDMMADQANRNTFDALVEYAKRLPPEMQAKFVKDSMKRNPETASTPAFVQWGVKFAEVLR